MFKVRITAVRKTVYKDLMTQYENPIEHSCDVCKGQQWISVNGQCPEGFCPSAWAVMRPFVRSLAHGQGNFYDGWMKNPLSAMISCNDGFRPVSFYLEVITEEPVTTSADADTAPDQRLDAATRVDRRVQKLLAALGKNVLTRKQIMATMGLKEKSRKSFTDNYFKPALERNLIEFVFPGTPSKPVQSYHLTPLGLAALSANSAN